MQTKTIQIDGNNYELRRGDIITVSAIVGCSMETVKRMLLPKDSPRYRSIDTETGKKVMEALRIIIETRQSLKLKYSQVA